MSDMKNPRFSSTNAPVAQGGRSRTGATGAIRVDKGRWSSGRKNHQVKVSTLAADMGYDSGDFLVALEMEDVRPHIAVRDGVIRADDAGGRRRAQAGATPAALPRISSESAQAQDRRRILRLGEDDRWTAAIKACRTMEDQAACRTDRCGLQPRANEAADGGVRSVKHRVRAR